MLSGAEGRSVLTSAPKGERAHAFLAAWVTLGGRWSILFIWTMRLLRLWTLGSSMPCCRTCVDRGAIPLPCTRRAQLRGGRRGSARVGGRDGRGFAREILFTGGGTESDNLAILGLAARLRPRNGMLSSPASSTPPSGRPRGASRPRASRLRGSRWTPTGSWTRRSSKTPCGRTPRSPPWCGRTTRSARWSP